MSCSGLRKIGWLKMPQSIGSPRASGIWAMEDAEIRTTGTQQAQLTGMTIFLLGRIRST
jgi:hypothetical protein